MSIQPKCSPINAALLKLKRRAEADELDRLIESFVDTGPILAALHSNDHQIVYGRRGTGKTHAMSYVATKVEDEGDISVVLDLRNVGSNSGMYSDAEVPLSERATRVLIDALMTVHDSIQSKIADSGRYTNNRKLFDLLESLSQSISDLRVVGQTSKEEFFGNDKTSSEGGSFAFDISSASPKLSVSSKGDIGGKSTHSVKTVHSGKASHYVNFARISSVFSDVIQEVNCRVWIFFDEWSSIPTDIQPYLADLIRRSILPVRGITVKIATIEHRSQFRLSSPNNGYIGMELGADIAADLNLDDYMVFENDKKRAVSFFKELLFRHVMATGVFDDNVKIRDSSTFVRMAFTQGGTFEEFVRATEGVPRDAINLAMKCAQAAFSTQITIQNVRTVAKTWYQTDKEGAVSNEKQALDLLHWIIAQVISHRKARAFLVRSNESIPLVDMLFDARILHILKKNISSPEEPGTRYNVLKLDYGCYVDLVTTSKYPKSMLPGFDLFEDDVEVPLDDYRAIRRAVLEVDPFFESTRQMKLWDN